MPLVPAAAAAVFDWRTALHAADPGASSLLVTHVDGSREHIRCAVTSGRGAAGTAVYAAHVWRRYVPELLRWRTTVAGILGNKLQRLPSCGVHGACPCVQGALLKI